MNIENEGGAPPAIPEGKYATFVADPPWRYGNTSTRGAAENHYPTMSIKELCDLDVVRTHAADSAHLYLWTTAGHLPEAFSVMEAWGFDYKTYLVWVKPQMGMGNYFRVSTELVLFGTRGDMRTRRRDVKNYFQANRAKHSAKPDMFHDLVESCSPGPYMELFSRCSADQMLTGCTCSKCRLGWTVWGNQA
jgi:N6-adenosine-specific RNA methylase IME4